MEPLIVIPARFESSRFPGKPLAVINGKPMIERTWRQCRQVVPGDQIVVATDDDRIVTECESFGARAVLTPKDCKTGTDRVASLLDSFDHEYFINVQGDEPLLNPDDLELMQEKINESDSEVLNGYCPISSPESFFSPNTPKVVTDSQNNLLYMSRAGIPTDKQHSFRKAWRQVCIYGFSRKALKDFRTWDTKTPLEAVEDIEVLRFLEHGYGVKMIEMSDRSIAVDLPEDLIKVEEELNRRGEE